MKTPKIKYIEKLLKKMHWKPPRKIHGKTLRKNTLLKNSKKKKYIEKPIEFVENDCTRTVSIGNSDLTF